MQAVWEAGGGMAAVRGAVCVAVAMCSAPRSSSAMWLEQVLLPASKCKSGGQGPKCQFFVPVPISSHWGKHLWSTGGRRGLHAAFQWQDHSTAVLLGALLPC